MYVWVKLLTAYNNNNNNKTEIKYMKSKMLFSFAFNNFQQIKLLPQSTIFSAYGPYTMPNHYHEKKILSHKWLHCVLCNNFVIFISFQSSTLLLFQTVGKIYTYIDSHNPNGTNERYLLNIFAEIKVRMMENFKMQLWNYCLFHFCSAIVK